MAEIGFGVNNDKKGEIGSLWILQYSVSWWSAHWLPKNIIHLMKSHQVMLLWSIYIMSHSLHICHPSVKFNKNITKRKKDFHLINCYRICFYYLLTVIKS